jgi:hypothetical protein
MRLNHSDDHQYARMQHFHSKRSAAQRFIHSIAAFSHYAIVNFAELSVSSFFFVSIQSFQCFINDRIIHKYFELVSDESVNFVQICMRSLFQIFQQFNFMKLIKLARSVFYNQDERDHLVKMRSIESHSLHLTKTDLNENHDNLIEDLSYETHRDCLFQNIIKRWKHAWYDFIRSKHCFL